MTIKAWSDIRTGTSEVVKNLLIFFGRVRKIVGFEWRSSLPNWSTIFFHKQLLLVIVNSSNTLYFLCSEQERRTPFCLGVKKKEKKMSM